MTKKNEKEAPVQKACLEMLEILGIFAWRNNTGVLKKEKRYVSFGYKGSCDILGICPDGRFLGIECKRPVGGKTSNAQKAFIHNIRSRGGVAFVAESTETLLKGLHFFNVIKEQGNANIKI